MEKYKSIDPNQLSIADGMIDWVRVVSKDNMVLYANKKMQEDLGENIIGKKCYDVLCRYNRCENCISSTTLEKGSIMRKHHKLGNKTYMIISSPLFDDKGEIEASVEVFRDITNEVLLSEKLQEKNKKMSDDIKFAKNMQNRMLPPKGMYNGLSIDYLYESSESLSGDYFDVFENVYAGSEILKECLERHHGNAKKALWCYNGHSRHGMREYVPKVLAVYAGLKQQHIVI